MNLYSRINFKPPGILPIAVQTEMEGRCTQLSDQRVPLSKEKAIRICIRPHWHLNGNPFQQDITSTIIESIVRGAAYYVISTTRHTKMDAQCIPSRPERHSGIEALIASYQCAWVLWVCASHSFRKVLSAV